MRITFVLPCLTVGGGVRVVYEYANRLQKRGHEVAVASIDGDMKQRWFPLNAPIISRSQLVNGAREIDVLVATSWHTAPIVLSLPARPRVYFPQMFDTLFYRDYRSQFDAYATYQWPFDGFVTISRWLQRMLFEEFGQESTIIPNGVNLDMFYPDPRFPKKDRVRVLIEGSHAHYKGVKDAFAAVSGLPVEVWSLSQQGPLGQVDRSFTLPSQDTIRQIYSSCDILLKTSWYEGRPCPHVEAMACGCAVVSTYMYGVDDLADGENALIVPPRDVPAIRAALVRLIEDPDLRQSLVEKGFETAHSLDWEKSAERMGKFLSGVLEKATTRSPRAAAQSSSPVHVALFNESGRERAQSSLAALANSIPLDQFSLSVIDDGLHTDAIDYFTNEGFPVFTRDEQDDASIWQQVVNQAKGCPIVLLSTSVRIDNPAWIECSLAQLEADSDIGILGVKIIYPDWNLAGAGGFIGPASHWALDRQIGYYGFRERHYTYNQLRNVDWVDHRCAIIRAEVAHDLLNIENSHPIGEGVVEYCLQAKERGWHVAYFPQVLAWLTSPEAVLGYLDFEELEELDVQSRRMMLRQKGWKHYVSVFSRDLKRYGLREVLKRFIRWLKWLSAGRA
jgi:glycosyltransferase involved in cell wall biosynthesis